MSLRTYTFLLLAISIFAAAGQAQHARKSKRTKSVNTQSTSTGSASGTQTTPGEGDRAVGPASPSASATAPQQDPQKSQQAASQQGPLAYKDIFPLLKEKCGKCHGSDPDGDLVLLTYKDLMAGGEHGSVVTPGQPEKSNLYLKLSDTPPFGKKMPKKGAPLTPEEIALLKKWITDGAKE